MIIRAQVYTEMASQPGAFYKTTPLFVTQINATPARASAALLRIFPMLPRRSESSSFQFEREVLKGFVVQKLMDLGLRPQFLTEASNTPSLYIVVHRSGKIVRAYPTEVRYGLALAMG